jgi:hypothetical protein
MNKSIRTWVRRLQTAAVAVTTFSLVSACGRDVGGVTPPVIGQLPPTMPNVPANTGGYNGLPGATEHGPNGAPRVVMKNVRYRVGPKLAIDVPALDGLKLTMQPGTPVVMDDPSQWTMMIQNGTFNLDAENVASLMNNYVFNYPDPPLKNLTATLSNGRMGIKGTMKKGIEIPFEMEGVPRAMANGKIELIPDRIVALGLPSQGLMKLIGLEMGKMVQVREGRGLAIEGNSVIMDPTKMLPAPAISGRVTNVNVAPDPRDGVMKLQISFGGGAQAVRDEKLPAPNAPNYLHVFGGNVRFVNTFNVFTNLQIVDADPSDLFDFYLAEYGIQMQAGLIVLSPQGWTQTIMPDYLKRGTPIRPNLPSNLLPAADHGAGGQAPYQSQSAARRKTAAASN